ncbi:MAG: hypothetical protein RLZZ626_769 [Actinomycetota bacterium]
MPEREVFRGTELGAGSILGILLLLVSLAGFGALAAATNFAISQQRLQQQTDSIALAAEDALRGITTGHPCDVAAQYATSYMVKLGECRILGFSVRVKTLTETMGIVFSAEASALPG